MRIHLQGMGLMGSLTARLLYDAGVDFVWNDTRAFGTAWRASAGLVLPRKGFPSRPLSDPGDHWLFNRWGYLTKGPPLGAKLTSAGKSRGLSSGMLNVVQEPLYSLDVERYVLATQDKFKDLERPELEPGRQIWITHGSFTADVFDWGWTAFVRLKDPPMWVASDSTAVRLAFYGMKHYQRVFAIPMQTAPAQLQPYLIGSSRVRQRIPETRDLNGCVKDWVRRVNLWGLPAVRIADVIEVRQGWRPVAFDPQFKRRAGDNALCFPAAGGDGLHTWHTLIRPFLEAQSLEHSSPR